jgi:hypothetical protein
VGSEAEWSRKQSGEAAGKQSEQSKVTAEKHWGQRVGHSTQ